MSKGYHLIYLPILFSLIIPIALLLYVLTIGVKIDFDTEWVHLRKSNTEPIIRIYAESETLSTAEHLANKIIMDIKEIVTDKVED